jgi:hypothetical protein
VGLLRALLNPWRLSVFLPAWLLMLLVFTAVRAVDYPHYLLILQPLPALLLANAFARQPETRPRLWQGVRWVHVVACAFAWAFTNTWVAERGGGEWPYGTSLALRRAQAQALVDDAAGRPVDVTLQGVSSDVGVVPCNPPPREVEWVLRQEFDPRWQTRPGTLLCEGWREVDGVRLLKWRVAHTP